MLFKKQNSRKKRPYGIFAQLKFILMSYCEHSTLHGFQYITNNKSSLVHRMFFLIVSFCSLTFCSYLILRETQTYKNPIMTTISTTSYPVWKVHFPSVTICNFNVVFSNHIGAVLNITDSYGIPQKDAFDFLENLSSLIILDEVHNPGRYAKIYHALNKEGYHTDRLMGELAHPCHLMIKTCKWQSKEWPCMKLFKFVKTTRGYCCAFNYYGTLGELENVEYSQFKHAKGAGPAFSLQVMLDVDGDKYLSATKPVYGFSVLVQDGVDYPDMDMYVNTLLVSEEMTISVKPRVFSASPAIEEYDVEQRCCYFDDEGNVKWMSKYSYRTCTSECKANAIVELCGCIPFYYPNKRNDTRVCTLLDVNCLQLNIYNINALEVESCDSNQTQVASILDKTSRTSNTSRCICYSQCNEILYDLHVDKIFDPNLNTQLDDGGNMSFLNVYYNVNGCLKYSRKVYNTWHNVLGAIGGIFGLCSGGSVISILELLYFILVRVIFGTPKSEKPHFYAADFAHHQYLKTKKAKRFTKRTRY